MKVLPPLTNPTPAALNLKFGQDDGPPATRAVSQNVPTGVGNSFSLFEDALPAQDDDQSDRYGYPIRLSVAYDDKANYFGGADAVKAYMKIDGQMAHHGGHPTALRDIEYPDISLKKDPKNGQYVGTLDEAQQGEVGDSEEDFNDLQLAFHDDNNKWDSNLGANYKEQL